jgi:hypothetical protein
MREKSGFFVLNRYPEIRFGRFKESERTADAGRLSLLRNWNEGTGGTQASIEDCQEMANHTISMMVRWKIPSEGE